MQDTRVKVFHSGEWDHSYDLKGKIVAVVGTGASSVQIVPELSGNCMCSKELRIGTLQATVYRWILYWMFEARWFFIFSGTIGNFVSRNVIPKYLSSHYTRQLPNEETRRKLFPNYRLGCKRVLPSNKFLKAFTKPNVELVTGGLDSFSKNGIFAQGKEYKVDCVVLSTGYMRPDFLFPFEIIGRENTSINDAWRGVPVAHLGMTPSKFPNFFFLLGPTTGLGHNSIIFMIECQVRYLIQCISHTFKCDHL